MLTRILGFAFFVIGVVLLIFGMNASDSVSEKVVEGVTGHFSDKTTFYIIGGIVGIILGLGLFFSTFRKKRR
jgi:LPXTG-motif cell wall-anchored protein